MKQKRKQKPLLLLAVLMFMIASPFQFAEAMNFSIGEDTSIDCDVQLIWGAGIRLNEPNPKNLKNINADDGNRNFDQWDLINNRFSTILDIDLKYKNVGYFIRPKAFYDTVYMEKNANDSPRTNNALIAGLIKKTNEFSDEVEDVHGRNVELLDYFGYANLKLGNMNFDIRAGNQVVQWGESMFITGIAGAMAQVDTATAVVPGSEVKEILLPSQSVSLNVGILDNLAIGCFYQWDWESTKYFEGGTFFNYLYDIVDKGGKALIIVPPMPPLLPNGAFLTRGKDYEPEDEGQYGFKIMYTAGEALNMTEFGLYYVYYSPKSAIDVGLKPTAFLPSPPFPPFVPAAGTYLGVYWDDVRLYGASFSSQIGEANVSGEIFYTHNYPIATKKGWRGDGFMTATSAWTGDDFVQAQVSSIYIYPAPANLRWLFEQATLVGEIGCQWVTGLDNDELMYDKWAWGATISVSPLIVNIFRGVDMSIPTSLSYKPKGYTGIGSYFVEGDNSFSIGPSFDIRKTYKFAIKYASYWDKDDDGLNDRDNISCSFKYTF